MGQTEDQHDLFSNEENLLPGDAFLGGADLSGDILGEVDTNPPDMVNHPPHYTASDNGIECIDAIRAALGREQFIGFLRGQVIKYQWRLMLKANPVEDNLKAIWYSGKLSAVLLEQPKVLKEKRS
jgi:hypothetical protein